MQKTNFPIEICIGEDGSTDGTREVCQGYAEKYPELIRLLLWDRNAEERRGLPPARYNFLNTLKNCKGKYVALLDGDDFWTDPFKLQKQVDFLEANPDYSICYHRVDVLDHLNHLQPEKLNSSELIVTYDLNDLAAANIISTLSVVYRNGLFEKFPDWFTGAPVADYGLHMLNAKHGKICYMPERMAVYRKHADGIWSNINQKQRDLIWCKMLELLIAEFNDRPTIQNTLRYQLSIYLGRLASFFAKENEFKEMKEYLLMAFNQSPRYVNEWMDNYVKLLIYHDRLNSNFLIKMQKIPRRLISKMSRIIFSVFKSLNNKSVLTDALKKLPF